MTNIIASLLLSNNRHDDKSEGNNAKENANLVSNRSQQDRNQPGAILSTSSSSSTLIREGIIAGKRIAKISVVTLVAIGIVELITGFLSGSVVATADGIDSLSDAMISFIVLLGLRIAHRPADRKFHFGYHKVESLAAMMAAIGMIIIGCIIVYHSYEALIHPREIKQPIFTMIVLAAAAAISLHRAFQMRVIANKYDLLSLKTDAKNSIKDGSASVIGFFSVLIASQFGFLQMDAIGGMIIAGYIFSVSYISLKQSSLILVDSWQNPKLTEMVKRIVEEKFKEEKVKQDRLDTSELLGFANNTLINFYSSQPDLDITIRKDGKDNYLEVITI